MKQKKSMTPKKYGIVENNIVYPSDTASISVDWDPKYKGAHHYTFRNCTGFENGKTQYVSSEQSIQFVMKMRMDQLFQDYKMNN